MSLTELDNINPSPYHNGQTFGRPSKYRAEFVEQATKLCNLGATDEQLAEFFQVDSDTIDNWKISHPDFFRAINTAKENWDFAIERTLFQKARGFHYKAEKVMQYEGEVIHAQYKEYCPPDTASIIFWLKNRQRARWRDVQDHNSTHEVIVHLDDKLDKIIARRALDAQIIDIEPKVIDAPQAHK